MAKTPTPSRKPEPEDEDENTNLPATTGASAIAIAAAGGNLPAFLQNKQSAAGRGLSNLDNDDVEIPRIKLLQGISKEVASGIGRAGDFYHTVLEKSLGSSLSITPIFIFKSFILWRPRWQNGGGILARALDGVNWTPKTGSWDIQISKDNPRNLVKWEIKDPTVKGSGLDNWGSSDPNNPESSPAATKMINIVAWLHDFPALSPAVITLQRSAIKPGKKLLGKLKMSTTAVYGMMLTMNSVTETNKNSEDFQNYSFVPNGFVQDEELYNNLEKLSQTFETSGVEIKDLDGLQGDEIPDGGGSAGSSGPVDKRV